MPEYYLHHKNDDCTWVSEEQSAAHNHAAIFLPDDAMAREWPGGYKMWHRRMWSEAPEWVKKLRDDPVQHASRATNP